jgi:glutamate dehydrogenase
MNADSMVAKESADPRLLDSLTRALMDSALPGEISDFSQEDLRSAANFMAGCAERRPPGIALVRLESLGGAVGQRRMLLGIINDDMPFLVDSVAHAIAARGLTIHRLLHPVVCVSRDEQGCLQSVERICDELPRRESMMYIELDRADARMRRELVSELHHVLADVRAAVGDWEALQQGMLTDADQAGEEGGALLRWFAGGALTLLGHHLEHSDGTFSEPKGILRIPGPPLWQDSARQSALAWFEKGGEAPLMAKSDRASSVHRHVPLDMIVMPVRDGKKFTGLSVHVGLWTSAALRARPEEVPLVRERLRALDGEFGFDPKGHAGKALRHSVASLPQDLVVSLPADAVKQLVVTVMSLADRPRPTLMLLTGALGRHLFAFVWLPRDELNTIRRMMIGSMLEEAAGTRVSSWSVELGDSDLALIRYTLDLEPGMPIPNSEDLDRRLVSMVRGWEPEVEEALGELVGAARATRLALTYMSDFPEEYRMRTSADDAARDMLRICGLAGAESRDARLYRKTSDPTDHLRLKTYRLAGVIPLSEAVPVFENFGFHVLEEVPTPLGDGHLGYIHDFTLDVRDDDTGVKVIERAEIVERAIAEVLQGEAENDAFNQLLVSVALEPRAVVLFRAWFRYLRQTGLSYSLLTVVEALRDAPEVAKGLIALFDAQHDPALQGSRTEAIRAAERAIERGLIHVAAIDDDRILRLIWGVVRATLRTNAFAPSGREALAFKLDSSMVPGLPAPVPWREIWVYSPRVEGIHLRGGPVARGGLRWSDRRDDFRTEILGLLKAQVVKNAVIVPTGAKGGFYPKQLPPVGERDAWLAEGKESYRIFIRSLLSVTDNIVDGEVIHPESVTIRDEDDPYFVVAADKGTATFSDVANEIALSRDFWLGDAFASGGSQGYDHKAMGITARGAWVSVQRHFLEMGIDVQAQPIRVAGVGDMSGDVFGNGMLLSKAIKVVAAFDHRHIFLDPDPDPGHSWEERNRMFNLPGSSWEEYDKSLISEGGGVFSRSQKSIPLSPQMKEMLDLEQDEIDPPALMRAILKSPVDLLWFGGIGTYVKSSAEAHADVGDPGNDNQRVDASDLRAKAIGEGANLAVTQAARIEFASAGGRVNTDFIDNSAGVDCSDNEVNIKIPLNREMTEGRLAFEDRNQLLAEMTEEVAALVLEDNRLQTLALSIAERGGPASLPSLVRAIEILEESGILNRSVEGLAGNEELLRRAQEDRGLTRPELAVLLSTAKMRLQSAIEAGTLTDDQALSRDLCNAFPRTMQEKHGEAILQHRLRCEIIATKIANRFVNRLGIIAPFSLTEEEGASFGQAASAFVAAERLFNMESLWRALDTLEVSEEVRLELFDQASRGLQLHVADLLRCTSPDLQPSEIVELVKPGLHKLSDAVDQLLRQEARTQSASQRSRLLELGAPSEIVDRIVRLFELNGGIGIAVLGRKLDQDEIVLTHAYTKLGEALGLDWAQSAANRFEARDQWERLLTSGLAREFEQLRLDFLSRHRSSDPKATVDKWVAGHAQRIDQFRRLVDRARTASVTTAPMLAQIATQARVLLGR